MLIPLPVLSSLCSDVTSQDFGCAVNRTSGSPSTSMYLVSSDSILQYSTSLILTLLLILIFQTNHFLDIYGSVFGIQTFYPDTARLNETNAESGYGSVGQGADNCIALWGRAPNFILLDFYDSEGNAPFNVAATLNGVSAPTNTVTPAETGTIGASATASKAVVSSSSLSGAVGEVQLVQGLVVGVAVVVGVCLGM